LRDMLKEGGWRLAVGGWEHREAEGKGGSGWRLAVGGWEKRVKVRRGGLGIEEVFLSAIR
ncbi:MAG: hypothetical protein NWS49_10040, partial [Opitutales bacterium]|nr:hypothetical protein [Opitutales bacterium]